MPDEEQTTQSISFTINDGTDPISGASVVIGGVSKTTGSAGGCTFDNIEEGTVSVEVSKDGFTTKTEEITVDSEHTSFTISLEATSNETGGDTTGNETGGETTGDEPTEETTEESFPSFRKVYKYRGGFDKWVYDQLKGASESTTEDTGEE
ncbi:MAG: carboxypeptidase regulatory-like domain-containing protein [Paludibacteraceae bacterium]|nr:carboxypeptidase regulatory-like domain-containing protein [Paludibacteraceae bacterium]